MRVFRSAIVASAVVAACWVGASATTAWAAAEVNVSAGGTEVGPGLAARGYDVVAYFTDGKPTLGKSEFTVAHDGATYRFASQAHLDAFKADPQKYLPQYGGYCAFGCFIGKKFDGDPLLWKIVDGKLYFNLNPDIQSKWSEGTAEKIRVADEKWKEIAHVAPADIK